MQLTRLQLKKARGKMLVWCVGVWRVGVWCVGVWCVGVGVFVGLCNSSHQQRYSMWVQSNFSTFLSFNLGRGYAIYEDMWPTCHLRLNTQGQVHFYLILLNHCIQKFRNVSNDM